MSARLTGTTKKTRRPRGRGPARGSSAHALPFIPPPGTMVLQEPARRRRRGRRGPAGPTRWGVRDDGPIRHALPATTRGSGSAGTTIPTSPSRMRSGAGRARCHPPGRPVRGGVRVSRPEDRLALGHRSLSSMIGGLVHEGRHVLTAVVGAEQELSSGVEAGADVRLGPAAVAPVRGGQGGSSAAFTSASPLVRVSASVRSHRPCADRQAFATVKHAVSFPGRRGAEVDGRCRDRDLSTDPPDATAPGPAVRLSGVVGGADTLPTCLRPAAKKTARRASPRPSTPPTTSRSRGPRGVCGKRPGMYIIGPPTPAASCTAWWEIIDNAVDEALGGFCDRSRSSSTATARSRSVTTDGVPRRHRAAHGPDRRRLVYTRLHAGGKFGGGSYRPPAASTASAPPSSTPSPPGSTSRSTAPARRTTR